MNALKLFNQVAPALCSCGELMTDPFEIKNGMCFCCQATAAGCSDEPPATASAAIAERFNSRSRHFHLKEIPA